MTHNEEEYSYRHNMTNSTVEERHDQASSKKGHAGANTEPLLTGSHKHKGIKPDSHQLYDDHTVQDMTLYNDHCVQDLTLHDCDDSQLLLYSQKRRQRCHFICWKLFMCIGVALVLCGVIVILVTSFIPHRPFMMKASGNPDDNIYIDVQAHEYNTNLEMSKLTGLILFCIGGVTLSLSLLVPSFLAQFCEEHMNDLDIRVVHKQTEPNGAPLKSSESIVLECSTTKNVHITRAIHQEIIHLTTPSTEKQAKFLNVRTQM